MLKTLMPMSPAFWTTMRLLDRQLDGIKIKQNVQSIFKEDVSDENIYYNSG